MTKKLTTQIFIEKSIKIWGNLYDYSKVNYIDTNNKVIIICKVHGEFEQLPSNHYRYKCSKCSKQSNKYTNSLKEKCKNEFILKANKVHNNLYDYTKSIYINAVTKLNVICKNHGKFLVSPNNHLRGKGCPKCGLLKRSISKLKDYEEYYLKFIKLYGEKNDYLTVVWHGSSSYITVICKKHGNFNTIPYLHVSGKDCPKCSNQYSKISLDWLIFMEVKYSTKIQHANNTGEFNIPNTRYKADGYAENINTIFEFNGDFWHGNPKIYDSKKINPRCGITYGELYQKTIQKNMIIKEKGFILIEIWENDWKKFVNNIKFLQKKWKIRKKKLFICRSKIIDIF